IESFSGYSFCKAHSATYAAESMQSLYLKTHFPIEFMVAVINNRGGFYPMEVYIRELVRLGASIEMPCLVHSSWMTRISHGKVYLGFSHIKGVTRQTGEALLSLRSRSDHIRKLDQVIGLVAAAQLDLLIEAGVFRTLEKVKSKLLFERLLLSNAAHVGQLQIFATPNFRYQADVDQTEVMEAQIQMRLLGFTLSTPFILFESLPYASLHLLRNKGTGENVMIIGYYVLEKPVTTDDGRHMCFATWYDQDLVFFDTVHFAEVLRKYPLKGKGVYEIKGTIEWHYGYPQIMVYFCRQIAALGDRIKTADILTYYEYLRLTEG
ncbi:MAG: hypothetical protein KDC53_23035, partial [Saprospiraceae bacterium]|nr:hypothetical protein [Saprospiraceae bacterium]